MRTALLTAICLLSCGCFQHRNIAQISANQFAAGEALAAPKETLIDGDRVTVPASYLRMVDRISIAIRLNAMESADLCGFTIPGAESWKASLPPYLLKPGLPTPPAP